MTDLQEKAMRMALEFCEDIGDFRGPYPYVDQTSIVGDSREVLQALRQALAQHVDAVNISQECVDETAKGGHEPVAWMTHTNDLQPLFHKTRASALNWQTQPTPLYTAPPKRKWVGLTDEQRAVLNFLLGADKLDGVWFGDRHPKETNSFWWRNRLRNAFQDVDIEAKLKEKNT